MTSGYISPPNQPERMFQRGRPVVPDFGEDEPLFLRYGLEDFADGQLALASIRFPKASVNRGSLSEPEDVLFAEDGRYNGLGAIELRVSDIPSEIEQPDGPTYGFFVRHVPLEGNYAHSEIWSGQVGHSGEYREPSKTVKLKFRIHLRQRINDDRIRIHAVRRRGE